MKTPQAQRWQRAGFVLLGLAATVLAAWLAMGARMVTVYAVAVETEVSDEFGDTFTTTVMEPGFRFGMLPDIGPDGALPWLLLFLVGATFAFFRSRMTSRSTP